MSMSWKIPLNFEQEKLLHSDLSVKYKVYADNALPKEKRMFLKEIEIVDLRRKTDRV